jgi:hypothetical protein
LHTSICLTAFLQTDPRMNDARNKEQLDLFREFKNEQAAIFGDDSIKFPNTHFVLHLYDVINDYGMAQLIDCEAEEV